LGILPLAFAEYVVFEKYFFRMYFVMLLIGIIHAFFFVPVFLTVSWELIDWCSGKKKKKKAAANESGDGESEQKQKQQPQQQQEESGNKKIEEQSDSVELDSKEES
jgi:hypothetical protein